MPSVGSVPIEAGPEVALSPYTHGYPSREENGPSSVALMEQPHGGPYHDSQTLSDTSRSVVHGTPSTESDQLAGHNDASTAGTDGFDHSFADLQSDWNSEDWSLDQVGFFHSPNNDEINGELDCFYG